MVNTNTRLYIANLGKYNEGYLVGKWINLPYTEDEWQDLMVEIQLAHRNESGEYVEGYEEDGIIYEELAIHDYESDIPCFNVSEYSNVDKVNSLIEEVEGLEDYEYQTLIAILESETDDLSRALEILNDDRAILYSADSLEELAMEFADEGLFSQEFLLEHIDWAGIARDMSFEGYTETNNGVLYCE